VFDLSIYDALVINLLYGFSELLLLQNTDTQTHLLNVCSEIMTTIRINSTLVKVTVTSRWKIRYTVKAVNMMDNSGSFSRSIISCLGPEIFVQINRILTKFCVMKVRGSGNYDTPCILTLSSTICHMTSLVTACLTFYIGLSLDSSKWYFRFSAMWLCCPYTLL